MMMKELIKPFIVGVMALASTHSIGQTKQLLHSAPVVHISDAYKLTPDITIIPDPRVNYVPNIGIIEGDRAILVVDAGMGPENGKKVFDYAHSIAKGRKIYLTTTHFHPEHSFGASAFNDGGATVLMNKLQADELQAKGKEYIRIFKQFGALERKVLAGTKIVKVDELYSGKKTLDLGNKMVEFYEMPAHTLGDQVIFIPDDGVVFLGDLVEERFFPIMPDADTKPSEWIAVMSKVRQLNPKTVIPGHGAVGGIALVIEVETYLSFVKNEVKKYIDQGLSRTDILATLKPKLTEARPNWDNAMFVPFEIAHFYAEWTQTKVVLPDLIAESNK